MKKADGMFLRTFREVAKDYPMIEANDLIVDNTCMQMVSNPHQFDVMVRFSLGSIKSNTQKQRLCQTYMVILSIIWPLVWLAVLVSSLANVTPPTTAFLRLVLAIPSPR